MTKETLNSQESFKVSLFTLAETAALYAQVFAALPWNEVWCCIGCNTFYGKEYQQYSLSPCCKIPLGQAYPLKETVNYIAEEYSQPNAKTVWSFDEGKLVGFAWGYQVANPADLAAKKWPQSEKDQANVVTVLNKYTDSDQPLFYISEVGVSSEYRNRGIGFRITQALLNQGLELDLPVIFRTNWASPMVKIATKLGMDQIMGPQTKIVNNQVVKTKWLVNCLDSINEGRVLFIKSTAE